MRPQMRRKKEVVFLQPPPSLSTTCLWSGIFNNDDLTVYFTFRFFFHMDAVQQKNIQTEERNRFISYKKVRLSPSRSCRVSQFPGSSKILLTT
jgi:hypothetical protein